MTVTVVCYKRPHLLRQCLESIVKADVSPVDEIIFALDYHSREMTEQMTAVIREFHNFLDNQDISRHTIRQPDRYGVANNTRAVYRQTSFNNICAIEEDTTVSPDAFVFADRMLNYKQYQFVNLCSHQNPTATDPTKVHEDNELRGGYGWAFTRDFWWAYLEPRWNGKNRAPYGWDWNVTYLCHREGWTVLTPEVSRVYNTGREGGTYDCPEHWDARVQNVCTVIPERYEIVKHPDLDRRQPDWVQAEMR